MEMPVFVPAGDRTLAAMVSVPDGPITGSPVVWFPGGYHPRTRDTALRDIARPLAAGGRPVMRLDYPGCGLSGGRRIKDEEEHAVVLNAAAEWFREICGTPSLTVGGTCRGAKLSVSLAAANPHIDHVVAVSCPLGRSRGPKVRVRKKRRRVLAAVAALDPLGTRMTSVLNRKVRSKEPGFDAIPGMVEDLVNASHARLSFIYGTEDVLFSAFRAMMNSGQIPPEVADRIEVIKRDGSQLYGFTKPRDIEWLKVVLTELLSPVVTEIP